MFFNKRFQVIQTLVVFTGKQQKIKQVSIGCHCGRDRTVVGFTSTYAISAYDH